MLQPRYLGGERCLWLWSTCFLLLLRIGVNTAFVVPVLPLPCSLQQQQQKLNLKTADRSYSSTALHGIPKMFRWLTDQYPDILNRQLIERNGLRTLPDVDCLYLDMNGIIHPCTHGNSETEIVLLDETAMLKKIFLYVDRLYKLVQPGELLYLAVDGVAPRAKMNQQRSRRFRSAKEAEWLESELVARNQYSADSKIGGAAAAAVPSNAQRFDR